MSKMIKKILLGTVLVIIIGVLVFGAVNRTLAKNSNENVGQNRYGLQAVENATDDGNIGSGNAQGSGNQENSRNGISRGDDNLDGNRNDDGNRQGSGNNGADELANLPPTTSSELSVDESAALLYMREEEKLAHDVYVTFYSKWGLSIFQNISQSEQTHTDAVQTLLDRYGLTDPASSEVGIFTNPDLQALYHNLVARGSESMAEAIKVGAAIEEIDIIDLETHLNQIDNIDIQQVFKNLLNGSHNHLRAFVSVFNAQTGETYQPQYLDVETYQAIIESGMGHGGKGRGGGREGGFTH
jgi:hypothetical protein